MWYIEKPELLEQLKVNLATNFPSLMAALETNGVHVKGNFPVMADGVMISSYRIDIVLPEDYPDGLPIIWETGGQIPRIADRHVNQTDHALCLFLADERWKYFPVGSDIIFYLNGPVTQYFINQEYFKLTGKWVNGDLRHGVDGIYDVYFEELLTQNRKVVRDFLRYLTIEITEEGQLCYCGSGKKLNDCHLNKLKDLKTKIQIADALRSLSLVECDVRLREKFGLSLED